jgi:hypothetical protein
MIYRMFVTSIVALGIGSMIAPIETSARPGGFTSVPSLPAAGVARAAIAGARFAHMAPRHGMAGSFAWHVHGSRLEGARDRREPGFPLWAGYAPYYYPPGYVVPSEQPAYVYPAYPPDYWEERSRPVVTYQPGCRTDTQTVPSESGSARTINITRCY